MITGMHETISPAVPVKRQSEVSKSSSRLVTEPDPYVDAQEARTKATEEADRGAVPASAV